MNRIEVSGDSPTLAEVLELAGQQNVILRTREGRQFVLAEIDDFADEVARAAQNDALTQLLDARASEGGRLSLQVVRQKLRTRRPGTRSAPKGRRP